MRSLQCERSAAAPLGGARSTMQVSPRNCCRPCTGRRWLRWSRSPA